MLGISVKDIFQGYRFFIPRPGAGINPELQNSEVYEETGAGAAGFSAEKGNTKLEIKRIIRAVPFSLKANSHTISRDCFMKSTFCTNSPKKFAFTLLLSSAAVNKMTAD